MIEMIELGESGVTRFIDEMMKLILKEDDYFCSLGKVFDKEGYCTHIAVFRDRCTVGKYSAIVSQWSTTRSFSGSGGSGFKRMEDFIETHNIKVKENTLSNEEIKQIGRSGEMHSWDERSKVWSKYAIIHIF